MRAPLYLLFVLICFSSINIAIGQLANSLPEENPLKHKSKLPYQAIPFDKIKDEHYRPALIEGLRQQLEEVNKIAENPAGPTFENTLVALELSGSLLDRTNAAFGSQTSANTNTTLQKLREEMAPKMAANSNEIYLNARLFQRIETIYKKRATLKLDAESKALLELTHQRFLLAGANLGAEAKVQMKKLNEEEATLSAKFGNMLVSATKNAAVVINDSSDLSGLSKGELSGYGQAAKNRGMQGKWVLPLQNTTQQPSLQSVKVRSTRQTIFEASWNRTEKGDSTDTRTIVTSLAAIQR